MNLNKVIIIGRLTRDPELKALPSGINVVSFSMATSRTYKDKAGAKKEDTEFHNMVAFGKQAETIAQYVKKGSILMVEGRIQTRSWESEGVKKYRTEIMIEQFQFGPKTASAPTASKPAEASAAKTTEEDPGPVHPDDIPF